MFLNQDDKSDEEEEYYEYSEEDEEEESEEQNNYITQSQNNPRKSKKEQTIKMLQEMEQKRKSQDLHFYKIGQSEINIPFDDNDIVYFSQVDQRSYINQKIKESYQNMTEVNYNQGRSLINQNYIPKIGMNNNQYINENEIDFSKIISIEKNQMYEPGSTIYQNNQNIPSLQKQGNHVLYLKEKDQKYVTQSVQNQEKQNTIITPQPNLAIDMLESPSELENKNQKNHQQILSNKQEQKNPLDQKKQLIDNQQEKKELIKKEIKEKQIEVNDLIPSIPDDTPYASPLQNIQIKDYRAFLISPAPKGGMIQCTILRDKSGLNRLLPKYTMILSHGYRYLMSAKKKLTCSASNYVVSQSQNHFESNGSFFLGKLSGDNNNNKFNLYDDGENPTKPTFTKAIRKQIGGIIFDNDKSQAKRPRKMKVIIPYTNEFGTVSQFQPTTKQDGLIEKYLNGQQIEEITVFQSRLPKWDDKAKCYVLNFYNRVSEASIKNFQLEINGIDRIYLQFGKVDEQTFNLDFQYPLSPLQSFLIALSSFDFKLES